jgi:hypothetical protein
LTNTLVSKAFPLITNSDALKFYKSLCEHAWNLLNITVSYLRCDNCKEFKEYLSDEGTVLDKTPDFTFQLSGTAGRNIRTVMNIMKSILKAAVLPKYLWAKPYVLDFTSRTGLQVPRNALLLHSDLVRNQAFLN